ncbi:zinc ribbon domain-containing protein [Streptantibioticus ferralitis]|uniref:Zinc ribbon domain-containing protein n=1 Tax=Streptantibioticus ferralitis TaxID=236510 RepID=A0ABT5Z1A2_9ACTN|nr:zinc ribbon domain-containing protein [Streptantibioticus ferralitis]MDF2257579.1 zinc ribbon domain-containing protein [Streptantibioticus ferralitis]
MRTCPDCGSANGDGDDFCGNCGAYLGWSRATSTTGPAAASSSPSAPAEPRRRDEKEAAPGGPAADARADASAADTGKPSASPARSPAPDAEPAGAPAAEAGSPLPRGAQPAAEARRTPEADPVAVQPAKPIPARPVVRPSAVDDAQDGPPCPRCGTPNRPGRRFCRRCAAPLTTAAPAPTLPWWRTRWPFRRRVRIGGSGNTLRRLITLIVVAAVVVAGILLYPAGRRAYEDVRDKLRGASAISPSGVSASAEVEGHPAAAAVDGLTNRYWGAPQLGASITFTFHTPFRLVDLIIHTGASTDPQQFQREARPTSLDLLATTSDGKVHEQTVTLNDKPGPQTVLTGISDVARMTLVIRAAAGTGPGRHIALGEVEFFKRG